MDPAQKRRVLGLILGLALMSQALAHDIWIEANQTLVRLGEQVNLALMLGNHGNHHRDFKLASKIPAGQQSLRVLTPEGTSI
ncbi:MAG: cobalt ABC transporter substrate-binding protein, partial [Armatimonadetes bacterium Cent15-Ar3]